MESKYLDQIRNITAEDDVERAKKIADIVMSTNESISATPNFAKEVRTVLIILIVSEGFSAHLYHNVMSMSWVQKQLFDFDEYNVVSEKDKDQAISFFNSAHIMALEGMLCTVFGMEYSGETCG
jgi:hypothetical protein